MLLAVAVSLTFIPYLRSLFIGSWGLFCANMQNKKTAVIHANDAVEVKLKNSAYSYLRYHMIARIKVNNGSIKIPALKTAISGVEGCWVVVCGALSVMRAWIVVFSAMLYEPRVLLSSSLCPLYISLTNLLLDISSAKFALQNNIIHL